VEVAREPAPFITEPAPRLHRRGALIVRPTSEDARRMSDVWAERCCSLSFLCPSGTARLRYSPGGGRAKRARLLQRVQRRAAARWFLYHPLALGRQGRQIHLCWPLGSSGLSLRALSLPPPCSEAAGYRERSALRLHGRHPESPRPALDAHAAARIIMHSLSLTMPQSATRRSSVEAHTRRAHSSHSHVIIQDHAGAVRGGVARLLSRLPVG